MTDLLKFHELPLFAQYRNQAAAKKSAGIIHETALSDAMLKTGKGSMLSCSAGTFSENC